MFKPQMRVRVLSADPGKEALVGREGTILADKRGFSAHGTQWYVQLDAVPGQPKRLELFSASQLGAV